MTVTRNLEKMKLKNLLRLKEDNFEINLYLIKSLKRYKFFVNFEKYFKFNQFNI
jgi:hypothetical protein